MAYNPQAKVFYGKSSSGAIAGDRLIPAPLITINQEMIYANDTVIGYSYIVSLNGYASSIDLSTNRIGTGIDDTLLSLTKVKGILNLNGGTLLVTNGSNATIMKAKGGTLRAISFAESDNRWVNYIPYTAEIEFNELEIADCGSTPGIISCSQLAPGIAESPQLLDMKKYKVKSFNDSWTFNLEDQIYNGYSDFRNDHFTISYRVQATGKHYFNDDRVLPAWEQAKNFVQYRVRSQVDALVTSVLKRTDNGCSPSSTLSNIHVVGSPGLLDNLSSTDYGIYNETISCETSEADGSFSAVYNAIVKRKTGGILQEAKAIHTFTVTRSVQNDGKSKNVTMSVDGNIQGLVEGGLIKSPTTFQFPSTGSVFISNAISNNNKYNSALAAYNKVGTKDSLNPAFQSLLQITNAVVLATGECIQPTGLPPPANHSISHNYSDGIISYKTDYTTERACNQTSSYRNISISIEDSVPVVQEFIIPGRLSGPIIQRIGPDTPKKVTLNIEGSSAPNCCVNPQSVVGDICATGLALPTGVPTSIANGKLIQDQMTSNPIDGSYSLTRTYILCCQ